MQFPKAMFEFQEASADEEACVALLRRVRWPGEFRCPRYGGHETYPLAASGIEQCGSCCYQAPVTSWTIFDKTRIPLRTRFLVIFLVRRDKGAFGRKTLVGAVAECRKHEGAAYAPGDA